MVLVSKIMDPHNLENDETLSAYQEALCSIVSVQPEMTGRKKLSRKLRNVQTKLMFINLMEICVCWMSVLMSDMSWKFSDISRCSSYHNLHPKRKQMKQRDLYILRLDTVVFYNSIYSYESLRIN